MVLKQSMVLESMLHTNLFMVIPFARDKTVSGSRESPSPCLFIETVSGLFMFSNNLLSLVFCWKLNI